MSQLGYLRFLPLAGLCFVIFLFIFPVFCIHIKSCFRGAVKKKENTIGKRSNVYEIESDVSESFDRSFIEPSIKTAEQINGKNECYIGDLAYSSTNIEASS